VGVAVTAIEGIRLRRPTEADYPALIVVVDEWWGERRLHDLLPRLWLQHFTGTSWIAEADDGRLAGFLIGFIGPDDPTKAYVHMIATNPNLRLRGLGRALHEAFREDVAGHGARQIRAVTWPGNRASVGFHRALGFRIDDGPLTQRLYGTSAYPAYDGEGADRVVFSLDITPGVAG
jgi:ribosomal protein S18 acetylase RimI-like enzyme